MRTKVEPPENKGGSHLQRGFLAGILFLSTGLLSACSTPSSHSASLAPSPPQRVIIERVHQYASVPVSLSQIEAASGPIAEDPRAVLALNSNNSPKGCRVKERFDRKYLIAYQWGRAGESKLGLDVDGVGFDSMNVEGVMLEYKLRLQPIANKKDRCRYNSNWQGFLGSGYNEFFLRDDDTVWQHLDEFQDEWSDNLDELFDN